MAEGGLETYAAERHPVGARVIRQTRALTRLVTVRHPLGRFLRDQMFAQVDRPERSAAAGSGPPGHGPRLRRARATATGWQHQPVVLIL